MPTFAFHRPSPKFLTLLAVASLFTALTGATMAENLYLERTTDGASLVVTVEDFVKFSYQKAYMPEKPSVEQFMKATRVDSATANQILFGMLDNKPDLRNWSVIMQSKDPLSAAKSAYGQMMDSRSPQYSYIQAELKRDPDPIEANTMPTAGALTGTPDKTKLIGQKPSAAPSVMLQEALDDYKSTHGM